ncbi:MAG: hypothetical protein M3Q80_01540 [bacterium]|nr:hypothetical protein [bacterium]
MIGILSKIKTAVHNKTTYRVGLLQTKAYRILKNNTDKALKRHAITSVHWAFLGILNDQINGMRAIDAAIELGVEAPFVTRLFSELEMKKLVDAIADTEDSRVKIICLTEEGKKFVKTTEIELREHMRSLIKDVSVNELMSYLTVLEKIIKNEINL